VNTDAIFFSSPAEFRAWLEEHHGTASELWVGYYKKATGKPTMTWPEAVDEALCFGWIDGSCSGSARSATGSGSRPGGAVAIGALSTSRRSRSCAHRDE
jgi:hypothetical protein